MTSLKLRALLALAATACALPALAAVDLYSQPLDAAQPLMDIAGMGNRSAVYNLPGDPGFNWTNGLDQELWVYFKPAQTGSFDQLTWYGSAADGNVALELFPSTCVSCQGVAVAGDGNWANTLLPLSGPFAASALQQAAVAPGVFEYRLDLPTPVTLTAGTMYGLTIVNNYSAQPFNWARATSGGSGGVVYSHGLARYLSYPSNLAFTLTDTTAVAPQVPEPATTTMWMLGLLAVGATAARRRR